MLPEEILSYLNHLNNIELHSNRFEPELKEKMRNKLINSKISRL